MDSSVIEALVPVLAVSAAVQQFLEILDPIANRFIGESDKGLVLGLVSFGLGLLLAFVCHLSVLIPLGVDAGVLDVLITALIVSAGTETTNSVMKYVSYAKESMKVGAATQEADARRDYVANDIMFKIDKRKPVR